MRQKIFDFNRRRIEKVLLDPPVLLRPLFSLLSLIFRLLAAIRRGFYRIGLLKRRTLPRPVVSIGNLSLGGGGKTPLVTWLARMVIAYGKKPAVLTRGYGRKSRVVRMATPSENWEEVGDEPFLISKSLPGVPVAVSPDRYKGGSEVLGCGGADLFILDDGFSHHALKKDLEVVVIDDRRRFGNGKMFPAGILREPIRRLRDADVVIVTKAELPDENFRERIHCFSDAPVLWADFRPVGLVPVGDAGKLKKTEEEGPFLAFCGIADPEAFRLSLERKGIGILELFVFPDHHPYTKSDIDAIMEKASELGAKALVTTEKDAVRWPCENAALPCFALTMEIFFLEGEERFQDAVCSLFGKTGPRGR